jgi:LysM repeat protein
MDRRPAPTVTTVEASDDTTSREYGTSGPHSGAQEGLPSMAGPASPPPRQILIKSGDTLMRIASQWYPDHGSQGLEAILRANPQITNRDLIYPGQVLTIPDLGRSAWAIQLREDLHYTFYGRFFSAVELQGALTRLVQNGVKHVVLSSMDAQGNTVYQIILGGYETVRELEGAQERARRNVR